jgi:hypothetical protein
MPVCTITGRNLRVWRSTEARREIWLLLALVTGRHLAWVH